MKFANFAANLTRQRPNVVTQHGFQFRYLTAMADVLELLQAGLSTLKSGQLPDGNLLKALVSKVCRCFPLATVTIHRN